MGQITQALGELVQSIVAFIVMIVLGIIGFYLTVFVVATGGRLAGFDPSGDFVILSATLLVVAAILAGGVSPIGFLGRSTTEAEAPASESPADD